MFFDRFNEHRRYAACKKKWDEVYTVRLKTFERCRSGDCRVRGLDSGVPTPVLREPRNLESAFLLPTLFPRIPSFHFVFFLHVTPHSLSLSLSFFLSADSSSLSTTFRYRRQSRKSFGPLWTYIRALSPGSK